MTKKVNVVLLFLIGLFIICMFNGCSVYVKDTDIMIPKAKTEAFMYDQKNFEANVVEESVKYLEESEEYEGSVEEMDSTVNVEQEEKPEYYYISAILLFMFLIIIIS